MTAEYASGLKVCMLGACTMEYGGQPILKSKNQSSRVFHLLLLLLYAGTGGIKRDHLISCLFGSGGKSDGSNNLRVTVHNLRKVLKASGLPQEPYICLEEGYYYFRSSFPVEVDALTFDELLKEAGQVSGWERVELLKKACRLYKGYFLSPLAGEAWVDAADARYQRQYDGCMREVCRFLKARGAYRELLELCSQAAALYPFDEWQIWQMDCLTALGRSGDAMDLYGRTAKLYFEELALEPSEQMLACFRRMEAKIRMHTEDLWAIQEKLREDRAPYGAYCCSYPGFVDSYRMLVRLLEQSEQTACLVLCALADHRKRHGEASRDMAELSEILSEAIRESLRPRDVYTRYSQSQFLVILMGLSEKACGEVLGRIDADFRKKEESRRVSVTYRIAPIKV